MSKTRGEHEVEGKETKHDKNGLDDACFLAHVVASVWQQGAVRRI
nr:MULTISPECIES: hypothetical protein [Dickeya]